MNVADLAWDNESCLWVNFTFTGIVSFSRESENERWNYDVKADICDNITRTYVPN